MYPGVPREVCTRVVRAGYTYSGYTLPTLPGLPCPGYIRREEASRRRRRNHPPARRRLPDRTTRITRIARMTIVHTACLQTARNTNFAPE